MTENVKLITTQNFNNIPCDFYKNINDEFLITREQIGTALGYKNPSEAIQSIHDKHNDRLDKFSTVLTLRTVLTLKTVDDISVECEKTFYTLRGIIEICRWSKQSVADEFMDWCWEVIDNLIKEEQQKQINNIISLLSRLVKGNRLIFDKLSQIEEWTAPPTPPTKRSAWKYNMSKKIKEISITLGIGEKGIKGIYGNIYNRMRNDYSMDVNNYKTDYLLTHKDVANPPFIDIVENYPELKKLFESLVDNYISIVKPSESESEVSPT